MKGEGEREFSVMKPKSNLHSESMSFNIQGVEKMSCVIKLVSNLIKQISLSNQATSNNNGSTNEHQHSIVIDIRTDAKIGKGQWPKRIPNREDTEQWSSGGDEVYIRLYDEDHLRSTISRNEQHQGPGRQTI